MTIRSGRHTKRTAIAVALLLAALVGIVIVIAGGGSKPTRPQGTGVGASRGALVRARPWFAPYVDLTLTPVPRFQAAAANPSGHVVLGFILAGTGDPCTPAWGGLSTLDQAATLNTQITEAQAAHEQVLVSFGGARGSDLAVGCTDPTKLEGAYQAVVARYSLSAIDLDVEGPASLNPTVSARRAQAIAAVQRGRVTAGKPLAVWLTLTVAPSGLEPSGRRVHSADASSRRQPRGCKRDGVRLRPFGWSDHPERQRGRTDGNRRPAPKVVSGQPHSRRPRWRLVSAGGDHYGRSHRHRGAGVGYLGRASAVRVCLRASPRAPL